jgi:hypothetical protein
VNEHTCKRCGRARLSWQVYCGAACSVMAEDGIPYPYLDSEKAEDAARALGNGEGSEDT